ncbi:glycosyltransferase family 4 protein [Paraburkholderia phymatum]|uniref:Glycosyl transferase group 1 n=1 Tax=Paraburkholderia phymatum (strain DSM 17167 / CIP 108236 / LMG 21445 / STM815) TaxID=391038 RepID=B2JNU9_PARP8|nr:glycosyltransferase family 4 protein [Paraburkholderia phymatum]ACC73050.1 glycosyl transferase group 1 [Paraburkholderia phymatum STM815]
MKIGLSCNALKYSGGLERYAIEVTRGLVAAGIKLAVFGRAFDPKLPESRLVEPHRINVSFLPGKWRDEWFSRRLSAMRRDAKVDVLIGCNRVEASEIAICGGTHLGFLSATGRRPSFFDRRQIALERRQYRRARFVVAHSPQMRDELRHLYGVDDAKIRVLYPPVDNGRFSPVASDERRALRKRFGFADDEVVLLFPSSSHERKGLPLIEEALRDLDLPVVVAVAGRPPERTSRRLRYIGYVNTIEEGYRAADYTILASSYEPFGLVGVESVMCGTPVILSSNIGCHDVIAREAKLVFEANDAGSLRSILARAVSDARRERPPMPAFSRDAVLYDPGLGHHVSDLLELADQACGWP